MPPKKRAKPPTGAGGQPPAKKAKKNNPPPEAAPEVIDPAARARAEALFDPYEIPLWDDVGPPILSAESGRIRRQLRDNPALLRAEYEARNLGVLPEGELHVGRVSRYADIIIHHENRRRRTIAQSPDGGYGTAPKPAKPKAPVEVPASPKAPIVKPTAASPKKPLQAPKPITKGSASPKKGKTAKKADPVRIQIVSDTHLVVETTLRTYTINPKAPILALLGDVSQIRDGVIFCEFLDRHLLLFQKVLLIYGNNEGYDSTWAEVHAVMQAYQDNRKANPVPGAGEFIILDRVALELSEDVVLLGCTLNSDIRPEQIPAILINRQEFWRIKEWSPAKHKAWFDTFLIWLNKTVAACALSHPNRRITIFTHHMPSPDIRGLTPANRSGTPESSAFYSDLRNEECWTNPAVKLWAWGHTHFNCDYVEEVTGKRCVTNQQQGDGYRDGLVLEL